MTEKILNPDCPCANSTCERHSDCTACLASHKSRGNLPACQRPKEGEKEG